MCVKGHWRQGHIISTVRESVVSSNMNHNLDGLWPCSHEEADTRILLHVKDALRQGYKDVMIRIVGKDVVLAVVCFQNLENLEKL